MKGREIAVFDSTWVWEPLWNTLPFYQKAAGARPAAVTEHDRYTHGKGLPFSAPMTEKRKSGEGCFLYYFLLNVSL